MKMMSEMQTGQRYINKRIQRKHISLLIKFEWQLLPRGVDIFWTVIRSRIKRPYERKSSSKVRLVEQVPQGSCLGPLLYTIFTNDLRIRQSKHLNVCWWFHYIFSRNKYQWFKYQTTERVTVSGRLDQQ